MASSRSESASANAAPKLGKAALADLPFDPRLLLWGLIALPILTWCWWTWSAINPGVQPARGAGPLLVVLAALLVWRPPAFGWSLRSPWPWFAGALAWQLVVWLGWADPESREPGFLWYGERLGAFCGALGMATWLAAKPDLSEEQLQEHRNRCAQAVMGIGGLVMALAGLSQIPVPAEYHPIPTQESGDWSLALKHVFDPKWPVWLSFGVATKIGADAPFGNPNFNVGGTLPLLGAGWAWIILHRRTSGIGVILALILALGGWFAYRGLYHAGSIAASTALIAFLPVLVLGLLKPWRVLPWFILVPVVLGSMGAMCVGSKVHWHQGQATIAVWVGVVAMSASALVLRLPRRIQAPLLLGGFAIGGLIMASFIFRWMDLPAGHSPSTGQRLEMWRSSLIAFEHNPILGHGVGSAITVVNRQDPAAENWLWVPGYAEHAHCEYLEWFIEGGLPQVGLLLVGIYFLIMPLWQRREDTAVAALLVAWIGVAAHGAVESHLSQVGPVLLIGLLAGLTWAAVPPVGGVPGHLRLPVRVAGALVASLLLVQSIRDFSPGIKLAQFFGVRGDATRAWEYAFDGGTPTMIAARCDRRLAIMTGTDPRVGCADPLGCAQEMVLRTSRLGPEDVNLTRAADYYLKAGEWRKAEPLLVRQLQRLPTDGNALILLLRIRHQYKVDGNAAEVTRVTDFLKERAERAAKALDTVQPNVNRLQFRTPTEMGVKMILGPKRLKDWSAQVPTEENDRPFPPLTGRLAPKTGTPGTVTGEIQASSTAAETGRTATGAVEAR